MSDFKVRKKTRSIRKKQKKAVPIDLYLGTVVCVAGLIVGLIGLIRERNVLLAVGGGLLLVGLIVVALGFKPTSSWGDLHMTPIGVRWQQGETVLGQLPYKNIAGVEIIWYWDFESKVELNGVGINLLNRRDPDTWWPKKHSNDDYDVVIPDRFGRPIVNLAGEIEGHADAARFRG
jgi:hypothetical protein